MSTEGVSAIRENYDFYKKLLGEHKYVFKEVIEVSRAGTNNSLLEEKAYVTHVDLESDLALTVAVRPNDHKFFRFRLQCGEFYNLPFFLYEADGGTHRNYDENIPLAQQRVTTPYFLRYSKEGIAIAYKTESLHNYRKRRILEDINFGIRYFCQEAKLNLRDDEYPEISILPGNLPLRITQEDPNSTVLFL